jgi:hypothetical protein
MKQFSKEKPSAIQKNNVYAYLVLFAAGLILLFRGEDLSMAGSCLALSLAFDPFDQSVAFGNRPLYQKALLLGQLLTALALMGFGFIGVPE